MKISSVSNLLPNLQNNKAAFGSKKVQQDDCDNNEHNVSLPYLKAYMVPKILFDSQIRQAVIDVFKEREEVLDNICTIKSRSCELQNTSKGIIDKSAQVIKDAQKQIDDYDGYCAEAIMNDFTGFEDKNANKIEFINDPDKAQGFTILKYNDGKLISEAKLSGKGKSTITIYNQDGTVDKIARNGFLTVVDKDVKTADSTNIAENYTFVGDKLFQYTNGAELKPDGTKSCLNSFIFDDNKMRSYKSNNKERDGVCTTDEIFEFDDTGFISKYQSGFAKSANKLVTAEKIVKFKDLGVPETYIEGSRYNEQDKRQTMSRAMMFEGVKLKYYAKYNACSRRLEKELTFDNGKLLQITINDRTIPPIQ